MTYGLSLDTNFAREGYSGEGLIISKLGKVTMRLKRDEERYGPLRCKGFKPGIRCTLRLHDISIYDDDIRKHTNNPGSPYSVEVFYPLRFSVFQKFMIGKNKILFFTITSKMWHF